MKVSKKYIIGIRKFLTNFVLVEYDEDKKLTHKYMHEFLSEKGYTIPTRAVYKKIKTSDILTGTFIFVKDEIGQVIPYQNPLLLDELRLIHEVNCKRKLYEEKSMLLDEETLSNAIKNRRELYLNKKLVSQSEQSVKNKPNTLKLVKGRS